MRRNLKAEHLIDYKRGWEESCRTTPDLPRVESRYQQIYYLNIHRFSGVYRQYSGKALLSAAPVSFKGGDCYDTLWHHDNNSLGYMEVLELREYLNDCFYEVQSSIDLLPISLIESAGGNAKDYVGRLFFFDLHFYAQDFPEENDLIENKGKLFGPSPTLRHVKEYVEDFVRVEVCLNVEPEYLYSSSAFIHLCESGVRRGVALLGSVRDVASSDEYYTRVQCNFSPIIICI